MLPVRGYYTLLCNDRDAGMGMGMGMGMDDWSIITTWGIVVRATKRVIGLRRVLGLHGSQLGLAALTCLGRILGRAFSPSGTVANLPVDPSRDHLGQISRDGLHLIVDLMVHSLRPLISSLSWAGHVRTITHLDHLDLLVVGSGVLPEPLGGGRIADWVFRAVVDQQWQILRPSIPGCLGVERHAAIEHIGQTAE